MGRRAHPGAPGRPRRRAGRRPPGRTRLLWVETPTNPLLGDRRHRRARRDRARGGRAAGRRQHLRHPVPAEPARPRRRRRRALDDEVLRRPLRRRRRRAGRARRRGGAVAGRRRRRRPGRGRAGRLPPERDGRGRRAVRRVAGAARPQDPRGADGAALRQRRAGRRVPRRPPAGAARCSTPGLPEHPGHDVAPKQMRRFGGMVSFRRRRRRGGRAQRLQAHRGVHPRRVPRRRREPRSSTPAG